VLYAGDLNAIQDGAAAQADFTQTIDLGTLRIGETGLQFLHYGTNEARLTGALRTDGILRGLGGTLAGAYTTTQRDAIPLGSRPYGVQILNITTNQYEFNSGTDATPAWRPTGVDPTGVLIFTGDQSSIHFTNQQPNNPIITSRRAGDTFDRSLYRENGRIEWGDGSGVTDTALARDAVGRIRIENDLLLSGTRLYFGNTSNSNILGDSAQITARVGNYFRVQNQDGSATYATIDSSGLQSNGMYAERTPRGGNRHIEMGVIQSAWTGFSTTGYGMAAFVDPFSAPPFVVFSMGQPDNGPVPRYGLNSSTNTYFDILSFSNTGSYTWHYVAEGPD
jgi:hypothetical protein